MNNRTDSVILAGDIGGTSTRLGFFDLPDARPVTTRVFSSRNFKGLEEVVAAFTAANPNRIVGACFGVAGPVRNGRVTTPNLPWVVDSSVLARRLGLPKVSLLNDLEANAYGIAALKPEDFVSLNAGAPDAAGNAAVISAGTGLGEAGLYWDGRSHHPFACEGGHADFAPRDALEVELLLHLRSKSAHVSYERILSGSGLVALYEFLRETQRGQESPAVAEQMRQGDPAAAITGAAVEKRCGLCVKAVEMFVSFYGAEAGNLALKIMATGGVFIGGGIAPRLLEQLKGPAFMEAFVSKGRMEPLLRGMPVRVIIKDTTALLGAARYAARAVPA